MQVVVNHSTRKSSNSSDDPFMERDAFKYETKKVQVYNLKISIDRYCRAQNAFLFKIAVFNFHSLTSEYFLINFIVENVTCVFFPPHLQLFTLLK